MRVDRHSVQYFQFRPGERINITVKEHDDRVLAKLCGAEGVRAISRGSHRLSFRMPESRAVEFELGTATTAEPHQLTGERGQVTLKISGERGGTYRHLINAEGGTSQWNYRLLPKSKSASRAWYVCSSTPPCNRPANRTGPANVVCKTCGQGVIVKVG